MQSMTWTTSLSEPAREPWCWCLGPGQIAEPDPSIETFDDMPATAKKKNWGIGFYLILSYLIFYR